MDAALKTMISNMPEKTGKSLEEWKQLLGAKQFSKHSEAVKYLKTEHGVTHGFANTIVTLSKDSGASPDDLVANQYKGKEVLFPIYEKIHSVVSQLGSDVTIAPKKTSVSFIRKKQFALITPATKTRADLGLKLKGEPLTERLENSGPFGSMCTHRVRLNDVSQIDKELIGWLQLAYEKAT
jgi:predicted transport protein